MNLLHFAYLLKNKETSFDCTHLENRLIKTTDKFRYQFIIDITGDKSELNKLSYLYLEIPPSPAVIREYNEMFIFIDEFVIGEEKDTQRYYNGKLVRRFILYSNIAAIEKTGRTKYVDESFNLYYQNMKLGYSPFRTITEQSEQNEQIFKVGTHFEHNTQTKTFKPTNINFEVDEKRTMLLGTHPDDFVYMDEYYKK